MFHKNIGSLFIISRLLNYMDYSDSFGSDGNNHRLKRGLSDESTIFFDGLANRDEVNSFLDEYGESLDRGQKRDYLRVSAYPADQFFQEAIDTTVQYGEEIAHLGVVGWPDLKNNLLEHGFKTKEV